MALSNLSDSMHYYLMAVDSLTPSLLLHQVERASHQTIRELTLLPDETKDTITKFISVVMFLYSAALLAEEEYDTP